MVVLCVYVDLAVTVGVKVRVTDHDTFTGNVELYVVVVVTDGKHVVRGFL